jgi:hypothetical protein
MGPKSRVIVALVALHLAGCDEPATEADIRACISAKARQLSKNENRRPSFEQAQEWGRQCASSFDPPPSAKQVDEMACAYSEDPARCGGSSPTD